MLSVVAPYSHVEYYTVELVEKLADLCSNYPIESARLLLLSLTDIDAVRISDEIKTIIESAFAQGEEGVYLAEGLAQRYADFGNVEPINWIKNIK